MTGALLDKLQGPLHLGQRTKGQEVDLHETRVVDAVLIPVTDVTPLHGAGLHRYLLGERGRAQDHATGVLSQVFGEAVELSRQVDQVAPHRRVGPVAELRQRHHLLVQIPGVMGVDPLGQLAQVLGGETQGLAHVADGTLDLVGADHAREDGPVGPPLLVHPLDELLTNITWKVQVDVGDRPVHIVVQEAVQRQVELQGIDM